MFFLLAKILILDFQSWNLQMLVDVEIETFIIMLMIKNMSSFLPFRNFNNLILLHFIINFVLQTYFRNWMVLQVPQKMTRAQILGHLVAPILGEGFVSVMIILSGDFLFTNVNIVYIK